jgi:hypothetical protein
MELVAIGLLAVAFVVAAVAAVLIARRGPDPVALQAVDSVARSLGQLQSEVGRILRAQDELRQDMTRGRESSVVQLAQAAEGIRGELGQAHKALAEVKALEQARTRQMDQAADSLKRLEAVVAGSATRGAAGENILARALGQLPPDLLEINVAFGSRIVEYALRLPGGRFLPIDSKWTSVALLERLETVAQDQPQERKRLLDQVVRDLRTKIRDMTKYLDPERTLSLGLLAVPDAVYVAAPEATGKACSSCRTRWPCPMCSRSTASRFASAARWTPTSSPRACAGSRRCCTGAPTRWSRASVAGWSRRRTHATRCATTCSRHGAPPSACSRPPPTSRPRRRCPSTFPSSWWASAIDAWPGARLRCPAWR